MSDGNDSQERGVFISFEGSEGCGKSTQITRLAQRFEDEGMPVLVTREPGGTPIGEEIRHLLMHAPDSDGMTPETELLLFAASRAQLVRQSIIPALEEGTYVLCDRFLDSTTVYQGVGRQLSEEPLQMINRFASGELLPDLTVVLDVPAEVGLARIRHRFNDLPDRMEKETISFYRKIREGYLILARQMPERFLVVDGNQEEPPVEEAIWNEFGRRFS